MKFGIFYEHQLPRPWTADSERTLIQNSLDQIELADRLGYDYAWEVEHHFLEEYSHSSAPEVFLAAASQRTKNIRLGHGIVQLTTNHPARVAERVVDARPGVERPRRARPGRRRLGHRAPSLRSPLPRQARGVGGGGAGDAADVLEPRLGVGRPLLQVPAAQRGAQAGAEAASAAVGRLLAARHHRLRRRIAAWARCASSSSTSHSARAWVNAYYNTFVHNQQKLTDYQTNPNIAVVGGFMCCETDEEAQRRSDGWTFFQFTLQTYNTEGPFKPGEMNFWERYQEWKKTPAGQRRTENELIGSPATIRKRLLELEKANVDQVILLNQAGKNTHEDICSSLEMFAREVMPEFHAARDRAPGVEARGARRRGDARDHRHRGLQHGGPAAPDAAAVR